MLSNPANKRKSHFYKFVSRFILKRNRNIPVKEHSQQINTELLERENKQENPLWRETHTVQK